MKSYIMSVLVLVILHCCDGRKSRMVCEHLDDIFGDDEICDFIYKGKCFFLLMKASRVDKLQAADACSQHEGKLANIYSEEHFEKARALIRSRILINHHYNNIWTGMTVDTQLRRIRLSDREWAPYERWYPNRPFATARGFVGIHTDANQNNANHGMFDEHATYRLLGGLCEK